MMTKHRKRSTHRSTDGDSVTVLAGCCDAFGDETTAGNCLVLHIMPLRLLRKICFGGFVSRRLRSGSEPPSHCDVIRAGYFKAMLRAGLFLSPVTVTAMLAYLFVVVCYGFLLCCAAIYDVMLSTSTVIDFTATDCLSPLLEISAQFSIYSSSSSPLVASWYYTTDDLLSWMNGYCSQQTGIFRSVAVGLPDTEVYQTRMLGVRI